MLCCSIISKTAEPNFFEVAKTVGHQRQSVVLRESTTTLKESRCQTQTNESLTPFQYQEYIRVNTQTTENNQDGPTAHGRFSVYLKNSGLYESRTSLFLNARETSHVTERQSHEIPLDRFSNSGKQSLKTDLRFLHQKSSAFLDAVKRDPPANISSKISIWKQEPIHFQQKQMAIIRKLY